MISFQVCANLVEILLGTSEAILKNTTALCHVWKEFSTCILGKVGHAVWEILKMVDDLENGEWFRTRTNQ